MTATPPGSKWQRGESSEIASGRPNSPSPRMLGLLRRGREPRPGDPPCHLARTGIAGGNPRPTARFVPSAPKFRSMVGSERLTQGSRRKIHPKGNLDEPGLDPTARAFRTQGFSPRRSLAGGLRWRNAAVAHPVHGHDCRRRGVRCAARLARIDQAHAERCAAHRTTKWSAERRTQCAAYGSQAARGRTVEADRATAHRRPPCGASVRRAAPCSS